MKFILKELYQSKLWAVAYVINRGCSDDCFDYFPGWLIFRGKETCLNALQDPNSMVDLDMPYEDDSMKMRQCYQLHQKSFNKK